MMGELAEKLASVGVFRRVLRPLRRGRATVFMIHRALDRHGGIGGHDLERMASGLDCLLSSGFRLISVSDIISAIETRRVISGDTVAFTIDDGYRDQAEKIVPLFLERKIPVTLFVATGLIDGKLWPWDAKVSWCVQHSRRQELPLRLGEVEMCFPLATDADRRRATRRLQSMFSGFDSIRLPQALRVLEDSSEVALPELPPTEYSPTSWSSLRELESRGLSVAPHTVSHRIVSRLSLDDAREEILGSWDRVRSEMREPVPAIAWPVGRYGQYGDRDMSIARAAGLRVGFSAIEGYCDYPAAIADARARFELDRFPWPDLRSTVVRYASGVEAGRGLLSRETRRKALPVGAFDSDVDERQRPSRGRLAALVRRGRPPALTDQRVVKPKWSKVSRLIFVCKGNICRSPYAAARAAQAGLDAISCGLIVKTSTSADHDAVRYALARGVDLTMHRSASIEELEIRPDDCLITMGESQLTSIMAMQFRVNCSMVSLAWWHQPPVADIPDPYGGPASSFHASFDLIDDCLDELVRDVMADRAL